VLNRAVEWGLIDVNPAKHGVDNPQRRRTEKRPFESWEGVEAVAAKLGHAVSRSGRGGRFVRDHIRDSRWNLVY
jgi:hypothetical protein